MRKIYLGPICFGLLFISFLLGLTYYVDLYHDNLIIERNLPEKLGLLTSSFSIIFSMFISLLIFIPLGLYIDNKLENKN